MEEESPPLPPVRSRLQVVGAILGSLAISAFGSGLALLAFLNWPEPAPFRMIDLERHFAVVNSDGILIESRQFEMLHTATIVVNRQLTRQEDSLQMRLQMPSTQTRYVEGRHIEHRLQGMPLFLPKGQYDLHHELCWRGLIRRKCMTLPVLEVAVNGHTPNEK